MPMKITEAIACVVKGDHLSENDMSSVMRAIMTGQATPAQIGGLLIALRMKGESLDEIVGAARVMRELALPVEVHASPVVDTCGTGGDGASLFNVSTASAFVVAAAGGHVAKHGNRSVSSPTGSADLLEAAGVDVAMSPEKVGRAIESVGVGLMFAQTHHAAMRHAIGPRRELAQRTIFNLLGPLTNPAGVKRQVIGVYDAALCEPLAEVLRRLGSEHALIVHSDDGLDELSIAADSLVAELSPSGQISAYKINPEMLGLQRRSLEGLAVGSAEQSLSLVQAALSGSVKGKRSADQSDIDAEAVSKAADMIALNAGAAIYVAGLALDLKSGVLMAQEAISTGAAAEKLKDLVEFSRSVS